VALFSTSSPVSCPSLTFSMGVETTQPLRANQKRRVSLVYTKTYQHGKAGKQNCDAAPPTRTAACHFAVLRCETVVVHARCCAPHRARCMHGTHACAWHTHAPPICSSTALAVPLCRDLLSAALLFGREKIATAVRSGADTFHACHTSCIHHCCFLPHLLLLLALQKQKLRGRSETTWGTLDPTDFGKGVHSLLSAKSPRLLEEYTPWCCDQGCSVGLTPLLLLTCSCLISNFFGTLSSLQPTPRRSALSYDVAQKTF